MFIRSGDFGYVKVKEHSFIHPDGLFTFTCCGWHKCNDKYRMEKDRSAADIIFVTVSGEGELCVDGITHKLTKDTVAYVPKSKKRCYYTPKGGLWEFYWLDTNGNMCDTFLEENYKTATQVHKTSKTGNYGDIIESILEIADNRGERVDREISMKVSEFLHLFLLDALNPDAKMSLSEMAMTYLSQHKHENITVEDCAKHLFVSPAHLIRVFKKETGTTPHKYLENERLKKANELLYSSPLSLREIAKLTGFSSSSHLIAVYKRKYHKTPRSN